MDNWLALEGKTVIVTGGSSGIGQAVATHLHAVGVNVVVADLHVPAEDTSNITTIATDITSRESVQAMVDQVIERYGRIDGLVNNAGINLPRLLVDGYNPDHPQYELDDDAFTAMMAVNIKGVYLAAQAVARHMVANQAGVIVNVSSEAGMEGSDGQSMYSATKGAVNGFTRSWAKELGRWGVRVVGIAPGILEPTGLRSPIYEAALAYTRGTTVDGLNQDYSSSIPLGRVGTLEEVATTIAFLLSPRGGYLAGTTVNVTGGKSRG
ncbi:SDR family oxidoreductase [Stomatohabitans albus]|uniref:SDR family oxidoreductase n=1 Tax=Stomatohabitans albus TaxID=3110766 RepID=UPI00300CFE60